MSEVDIFGIDLGTTNSAIAVWSAETGTARVLPNQEGANITPSAVVFDAETGVAVVGSAAIDRMLDAPERVVYSVKRFIGRTFAEASVGEDQKNVTYRIEEAGQRKTLVCVGDRSLTPQEISAEILRKVKTDAETALDRTIEKAVITVPAYFNEAQRQATKEAGEKAGLFVPRIINEPTAAALAFGLGVAPQTVAVYDLGGGTFDISILRMEDGLFTVLGISGDTHLGGDDLDMAIVGWMQEAFEKQHGATLPVESDIRLRARLREAAEEAKIALTGETKVPIHLPELANIGGESLGLEATLTRDMLNGLSGPLLERTLTACEEALQKAGLEKEAIDQVLMVGGQTRTLAVRDALRKRFGWKLNDSVNPDEAVALGAGVMGARLCGYLKEQAKLRDVTPLSLGIEQANGSLKVLVPANQRIPYQMPAGSAPEWTTQRDGQESVTFRIYQGERVRATDNLFLGEVEMKLTTSQPAGAPRLLCLFHVDSNGVLNVEAQDVVAGRTVETKIDYTYRLTDEEVEDARRSAEQHREEDTITLRVLALREELAKAAFSLPSDVDTTLRERLDAIRTALDARNVALAETLLRATAPSSEN